MKNVLKSKGNGTNKAQSDRNVICLLILLSRDSGFKVLTQAKRMILTVFLVGLHQTNLKLQILVCYRGRYAKAHRDWKPRVDLSFKVSSTGKSICTGQGYFQNAIELDSVNSLWMMCPDSRSKVVALNHHRKGDCGDHDRHHNQGSN